MQKCRNQIPTFILWLWDYVSATVNNYGSGSTTAKSYDFYGSGSGSATLFWWPKMENNLQRTKIWYFSDQKLQFTYPSIKDVQATGEAFNSQNRISSTSKHEISSLSVFLWVISALLDPDQADHNQFRSGSETLEDTVPPLPLGFAPCWHLSRFSL